MSFIGVWAGAMLVAGAGEMQSVSQYEQYKALSNDPKYRWAGAVTARQSTGNIVTASCIAVAPTVVIGAGHFTPSPSSLSVILTVTFGQNHNSGERLIMEVDRWERHPDYITGNPNTIDLGIYHLKQPISNFTPVTIADALIGTNLVMVDFGKYGDSTTGPLLSLGDRIAGRATISNRFSQSTAYPLTKYALLNFEGIGSNRTKALLGSSGSPWYDADGSLVFLSTAASNDMSGYTVSLRLKLPEVQAWLQPKIAASWAAVPADYGNPPQLACTAGAGSVTVSWDEKASGLLLKKSVDLNVWERVDRAGGATIIYGPGTLDDPIANRPSQFYRLFKP